MSRTPAKALILFDIDGTLLRRAGPHHREALVKAVKRVTGLETTTEGVPVAGMLDRDILHAMLSSAGASGALIRRQMPQIVEYAQRVYGRICPDLRMSVCPGARMLLYKLSRRGIPAGPGHGQPDTHRLEKDGARGAAPLPAFRRVCRAGP